MSKFNKKKDSKKEEITKELQMKKLKKKKKTIGIRLESFREWLKKKLWPLVAFIKFLGRHSLRATIIWSFLLCIIIETAGRHSLLQAFEFIYQQPIRYILNVAIIFAPFTLVYLMKKRIIGFSIISLLWLTMGITNGVVLSKRVTPFTCVDIKLVDAAMSILKNYMEIWQIVLIFLVAILAILAIILLIYLVPARKEKINYKKNFTSLISYWVCFLCVMYAAIKGGIFATYFGNIAYAYLDYGVTYCFSITGIRNGIHAPTDYADVKMGDLITKINNTASGEKKSTNEPNIIFLQLESFFDINHSTDYTFSENPVPYFESLKENYTSGYLTVPVVGAGTANTEFEVMTGMRLAYFSPGEYPYKTILKKTTCESAPYDLKILGYHSHAIHNNVAKFYGRNVVFPNLGYDTFTSIETMTSMDKTPIGWCKDKYLTRTITDCLESTKGSDYVYTISVQGHGDYYKNEAVLTNPEITVEGCESEDQKNAVEYYVQQIHEMDQFLQALTEKLSQIDENTVLVLYGDHLPGLGFSENTLDNKNLYQTEYVMWDNFRLKKKDKNVTTYQLTARVMDLLDIHVGTMFNYHQQYAGKKGYSDNMKSLEYDMLYGKQYIYGGSNPYEPTDMKFGTRSMALTQATNTNGNVIISGKNFTRYSHIYLNDDEVETVFIADNMLKINDTQLEEGDTLSIKQTGTGDLIYTTTDTFVWHEDGTLTKAPSEE